MPNPFTEMSQHDLRSPMNSSWLPNSKMKPFGALLLMRFAGPAVLSAARWAGRHPLGAFALLAAAGVYYFSKADTLRAARKIAAT